MYFKQQKKKQTILSICFEFYKNINQNAIKKLRETQSFKYN